MARKQYIALSDGFLSASNRSIKQFQKFWWDGPPGSWMHPADEPLPPGFGEKDEEDDDTPETNHEILTRAKKARGGGKKKGKAVAEGDDAGTGDED